MRNTKYMMSGGLAFAEEKDMEKLRAFSVKGWHVRDFAFMGYVLEKGNSTEYIYSLDYRQVKEDEAEEYFDFFSSSGWTHITSQGEIHLFRALPGTKPIHSDRETVAEKHGNMGKPTRWLAIPLVCISVMLWAGAVLSEGFIEGIFSVAAAVSCIFAIPAVWTAMTVYSNKWRAEGKVGLAKLVKLVPVLIVLFAAFIIFTGASGFGGSFRLLAYMLLGAVALPTVIWMSMSVYQIVRRKTGQKHIN